MECDPFAAGEVGSSDERKGDLATDDLNALDILCFSYVLPNTYEYKCSMEDGGVRPLRFCDFIFNACLKIAFCVGNWLNGDDFRDYI
jgi:hypothetical protein